MILCSKYECSRTNYDVTRAYFDDEVTQCYSYDFEYHILSYFGIKFVSRQAKNFLIRDQDHLFLFRLSHLSHRNLATTPTQIHSLILASFDIISIKFIVTLKKNQEEPLTNLMMELVSLNQLKICFFNMDQVKPLLLMEKLQMLDFCLNLGHRLHQANSWLPSFVLQEHELAITIR